MKRVSVMLPASAILSLATGVFAAWLCFGGSPSGSSSTEVAEKGKPKLRSAAPDLREMVEDAPHALREAVESSAGFLRDGEVAAALESLASLSGDQQSEAVLRLIAGCDGVQAEQMTRFLVEVFRDQAEGPAREVVESLGENVLLSLVEKWALLDWNGYLAHAESLAGGDADHVGMELAQLGIAFMLPHDRSRANEAIRRIAERWPEEFGEDRGDALANMPGGLVLQSTAEGIAWLREADPEFEDFDEVFENGIREPHATLEEILKIENGDAREETLDVFFEKWAVQDPEAARLAAMGFDDESRDAFMTVVVPELVKLRPEEGMRIAVESGNELLGLDAWAEFDPMSAVAWAQENGNREMLGRFLTRSEESLPLELGLELLQNAENVLSFGDNNSGLLYRWVQSEPVEVLAWASRQPGSGAAFLGREAAIRLYEAEPRTAFTVYGALPEGPVRERFRKSWMEQMAIDDPESAEAVIARMPEQDATRARREFYNALAMVEPECAYEGAVRSGNEETVQTVVSHWLWSDGASEVFERVRENMGALAPLREAVVNAWADEDPWEAGGALLEAEGVVRDEGIATLVGRWAERNAEDASRFINASLEPGLLRDNAVVVLIEKIHAKDPASAREWAESLENPEVREHALDALLQVEEAGES